MLIDNNTLGGIGLDVLGTFGFGWSLTDLMTPGQLDIDSSGSDNTSSMYTTSSTLVYETPMLVDSRTCSVKFRNNVVNENFRLLGWKIFYQDKDMGRMDGDFVFR